MSEVICSYFKPGRRALLMLETLLFFEIGLKRPPIKTQYTPSEHHQHPLKFQSFWHTYKIQADSNINFLLQPTMKTLVLLVVVCALAYSVADVSQGQQRPPSNRPGRFLSLPIPQKCANRKYFEISMIILEPIQYENKCFDEYTKDTCIILERN